MTMGSNKSASIWSVDGPASWPEAPAEMTVTTLGKVEACPRRWALSTAYYPELWSGRGYPPRVQLSSLSGSVVHLALEEITRALVRARCQSFQDPIALQVMKELGGYTKIVNDCIDRAIKRLASSPRAHHGLEFAARSLRAQVPEFRTRVQTMLCRVRLPWVQVRHAEGSVPTARGPLTTGAYPEIDLRAEQIGWKGKADLLVLSSEVCEIIDFKTGAPGEEHIFQIQVYALLWSRAAVLNPNRRRADRLILAYSSGDVEVAAPTDSELDDLERQLVARAAAARAAISQRPPEAKPSPEHCIYCDVRHLCTAYWATETQRLIGHAMSDRRVTDITIRITGRHGPSSWDAVVEGCPIVKRGQRLLLRADNRPLPLRTGQVVRLLSVYVSESSEEDLESVVIATMGAGSEVFSVS